MATGHTQNIEKPWQPWIQLEQTLLMLRGVESRFRELTPVTMVFPRSAKFRITLLPCYWV